VFYKGELMSETPIGDEVLGPEGGFTQATEAPEDDVVVMTDPYRIPGEDDPDDPEAADATDQDALAEPTDNSGEQLAEADDVPQGVDDVVDNADELDGDEPAPDGQE
jgi:hypothetical protein